VRHSALFDVSKPLEIRMIHQVCNNIPGQADKSVNGVVKYFNFGQFGNNNFAK
jgi:hypothetical protein